MQHLVGVMPRSPREGAGIQGTWTCMAHLTARAEVDERDSHSLAFSPDPVLSTQPRVTSAGSMCALHHGALQIHMKFLRPPLFHRFHRLGTVVGFCVFCFVLFSSVFVKQA